MVAVSPGKLDDLSHPRVSAGELVLELSAMSTVLDLVVRTWRDAGSRARKWAVGIAVVLVLALVGAVTSRSPTPAADQPKGRDASLADRQKKAETVASASAAKVAAERRELESALGHLQSPAWAGRWSTSRQVMKWKSSPNVYVLRVETGDAWQKMTAKQQLVAARALQREWHKALELATAGYLSQFMAYLEVRKPDGILVGSTGVLGDWGFEDVKDQQAAL